jgi:hypothetical protein
MMATAEIDGTSPEESETFGLLFEDSDIDYFGPTVTLDTEEVYEHFLPSHLATELYDLLKCTHAIFEHFGITYWLTGGSMIGYMRHGGIIPWDDDIDICCFWKDKERVFSQEVLDTFKLNNVNIVNDLTYNIENLMLSKIYRSTASSKANKSGKVPYPFIDIFYVKEHYETIRFLDGNDNHWIHPDELHPLKTINFGPVRANIPRDPVPQLDRGYGKDWPVQGQIHTNDHVTKQGRGGPRRVFDVAPFLNISASYSSQEITSEVILPLRRE